jgi:hypothetical protein
VCSSRRVFPQEGTGCNLPLFRSLDAQLVAAVRSGSIRLLAADCIRSGSLHSMARRQELEARERRGEGPFFLSPKIAAVALEKGDRSVGVLTFAWGSPEQPDDDGTRFHAVQQFLQSPQGVHIRALFVDFMSLPQSPRTPVEDAQLALAFTVMAALYASATGTTVLRHATAQANDATVRPYWKRGWPVFESGVTNEVLARFTFFPRVVAALERLSPKVFDIGEGGSSAGHSAASGECGAEYDADVVDGAGPRIERVRSAIEAATFTYQADRPRVINLYNEFIGNLNQAMKISGEDVAYTYGGETNAEGQREGRGTLWGSNGDVYEGEWKTGRPEGWGLLRCAGGDVYEGEWKMGKLNGHCKCRYASGASYDGEFVADKKHGKGSYRFTDGSLYEGEYRNDKRDGNGTFRFAMGDVYEGAYVGDKKHGGGTYRYADGMCKVSDYRAGVAVGEGARWSNDGLVAMRLMDGEERQIISLEDARRIAARLNLPAPFNI